MPLRPEGTDRTQPRGPKVQSFLLAIWSAQEVPKKSPTLGFAGKERLVLFSTIRMSVARPPPAQVVIDAAQKAGSLREREGERERGIERERERQGKKEKKKERKT